MSAAQTRSDSEQRWGCLESLGLSPRELVLAEALQMEYDALSRLKQDKSPASKGVSEGGKGPAGGGGGERLGSGSVSGPSLGPHERNLNRGLSGSDPTLNLAPGGSSPTRPNLEPPSYSKEPLYILDSPIKSDYESPNLLHPKNFTPPDDPPPAIPPRNPLPPDPFPARRGAPPRDVNLFTPDADQPKVSGGDSLNYDNLNESLSRLNREWGGPRGRRGNGEASGKPVARSKTLPPQVPPRTYIPVQKSNKNQRRVSADPVTLGSRLNGFGYELFQVSEERDEEVAAFCHMLDVLRSAYPCSDVSQNAGFVSSLCLSQDELQHGLGISIKVTVINDHFRDPLTFTCDGSSTVDLLIYQTLCYAHDDLDLIDVDDYILKVCGQAEFLKK